MVTSTDIIHKVGFSCVIDLADTGMPVVDFTLEDHPFVVTFDQFNATSAIPAFPSESSTDP